MVVTIIGGCYGDGSTGEDQSLDGDDDEPMDARQTRGIFLRSWRNVQQKQQPDDQEQQQENKNSEPILSPVPLHRDLTSHILSGMSAPMRLVLLQRLTGYDKRTPSGKSFLGMRGKKMDAINNQLKLQHEEEQEDYSSQLKSSDEDDESNYYTVPDKKKEKFLGMRGKKEYGSDNSNYLLRQLQQMAESKKRVPSSNAFMGVRGKRSG